MSDDEMRAFLEEGRTLQVATVGGDGMPHLVAMWYCLLDGDVAFWTYGRSQKVVDLRRDPRIACLVESGETYDQLRGVQLRGHAEVSEDRDVVRRVGEGVFERYTGPVDDNARQALEVMGAKRVAIIVRPDKIVSWDHRKLGGRY